MTYTDWSNAPCTKVEPDTFFPDLPGNGVYGQVQAAAQVCATCPSATRAKCAQRAIDGNDYYGVWAGVYVAAHGAGRRVAIAELRKIAGVEASKRPRPRRRAVPKPCAGDCGRIIRSSGATLAEFPGTLSNIGGWRCRPCFDRANGIVRGKS